MAILLNHIKDVGLGSKGNCKPLRELTQGSGLIRFTFKTYDYFNRVKKE